MTSKQDIFISLAIFICIAFFVVGVNIAIGAMITYFLAQITELPFTWWSVAGITAIISAVSSISSSHINVE